MSASVDRRGDGGRAVKRRAVVPRPAIPEEGVTAASGNSGTGGDGRRCPGGDGAGSMGDAYGGRPPPWSEGQRAPRESVGGGFKRPLGESGFVDRRKEAERTQQRPRLQEMARPAIPADAVIVEVRPGRKEARMGGIKEVRIYRAMLGDGE